MPLPSEFNVLLVTATEIETRCLHNVMRPRDGRKSLEIVHYDSQTYFIGTYGKFDVLHVQCGMGSLSRNGSTLTINEAIRYWKPTAVIMLGIAFGVDEKKQRIGDVLVASSIAPYEQQRVSRDKVLQRGVSSPCGGKLINRFTNTKEWVYLLPGNVQSRVFPGMLLSGEKLIDNLEFRNKILEAYPEAIGGEMEGSGLAIAADSLKTEWILIKGICDWADGFKSEDKDERQEIAAKAAIALCEHALSNPTFFDGFGTLKSEPRMATNEDIEKALFAIYRPEVQHWYLEREVEKSITKNISNKHVWIWGASGIGKTTLLLHCGYSQFKKVLFVDLSAVAGESISVLLTEIIWTLHEAAQSNGDHQNPSGSVQDLSREIIRVIKSTGLKDTFIVIDEFSGDEKSAQDFIRQIGNILVRISNDSEISNVRIAIGSIQAPLSAGAPGNHKIFERVSVIELIPWEIDECLKWLSLIADSAPEFIDETLCKRIANAANGCPRRLKMIARLHLQYCHSPGWSADDTIRQYNDEFPS